MGKAVVPMLARLGPNSRGELPDEVVEFTDIYFSADVETDGPIPGPFSILSFALVYAGTFDGRHFHKPSHYEHVFYRELKPISDTFDPEALKVNGLDRERLQLEGCDPDVAMAEAYDWVSNLGSGKPVIVAYPLCFDWSWLYWYFVKFSKKGSPFGYSRCFDVKTAVSVRKGIPISLAGRARLQNDLAPMRVHTHHAVDDAIEQAEIFANLLELGGDAWASSMIAERKQRGG